MNENSICKRRSEKVTIGAIQMYCEHFIMTGHTQLYEKSNMGGNGVITGRCPKSKKITFIGRVYHKNDPFTASRLIASLNGLRTYVTTYRSMLFYNCDIHDFKIEDKGEDFIYLTLTLATPLHVDYYANGGTS